MVATTVMGLGRAVRLIGAGVLALALSGCGRSAENEAKPVRRPDAGQPYMGESAPISPPIPSAATPATDLDTSGWAVRPPFHAAGDEPYWRLDLADGWFVFRRSGLPEIEAPIVAPTSGSGADVFDAPPLTVSIRREPCESAGLAAQAAAVVTFDGIDYGGCVFEGDWSAAGAQADAAGPGVPADFAAVTGALPAIDACLARLGESALVTALYERGEGRTAMILQDREGRTHECGVEASGEIGFLDEVDPRDLNARGAPDMRFLREGQLSPHTCPAAQEVRVGGVLVGRLLAKDCRF